MSRAAARFSHPSPAADPCHRAWLESALHAARTGTATACVVLAIAGCSKPAAPPAPPRPAPAPTPTAATEQATPEPAAPQPTTPRQTAAPAVPPAPAPTAPANDVEADVAAVKDAGTAAVTALLGSLSAATDEDGRVAAIDDIAKLGAAAAPALDKLLEAAAHASERIRWHAVRAIGRIGHDAAPAIPALIDALGDADPIVVSQAAAALGEIRADDPRHVADLPAAEADRFAKALDALVKASSHGDARARRAALKGLKAFNAGPETLGPLFVRLLSDSDPSVILPALRSLADIGEPAVPLLRKALQDPKARYWASIALMEMGPKAASATDDLIALLGAGEIDERMQAGLALAAIGEPAAAATDELAALLETPDGALRFTGAYALGRVRGAGADAALEKAAADPDAFLATIAAWARARIHPDDVTLVDAAVGRLGEGLKSDRPNVRAAALRGLADLRGAIADEQEAAVAHDMVRLLTDPKPDVSMAAAEALVQMGPTAVAALEEALGDPSLRMPAVQLLAALGKLSHPAVDSLTKALEETDTLVQGEAALALASVGPEAAEAIPGLVRILTAPAAPDTAEPSATDAVGTVAGNRLAAAYALGKIGPAATAAVAPLAALADKGDDPMLATMASWALLKIEPGNATYFEQAVPRLRKALRSEREMARVEAARALGEIGAPAKSAIPMLELMSDGDPSEAVRAAAAAALRALKNGAEAR